MTQSKPPAGTAPAGSDDKDPAEIAKIEADIDQTRNAISGDLRTLGERLSPEHLKEEAKEVMTEAKNVAVETLHEAKNVATSTFREVKDDAMNTVSAKVDELRDNVRSVEREAVGFVRENAVPLALIGVGVAWFLSNRRSRDASWDGGYRPRDYGRWRYPEPEGRHAIDDARDGVYRAAGTTRELGERAKERCRRLVDDARHELSDRAGQVRDFAEREVH
jgi:vacuolar-type H+-ATPase subunit H